MAGLRTATREQPRLSTTAESLRRREEKPSAAKDRQYNRNKEKQGTPWPDIPLIMQAGVTAPHDLLSSRLHIVSSCFTSFKVSSNLNSPVDIVRAQYATFCFIITLFGFNTTFAFMTFVFTLKKVTYKAHYLEMTTKKKKQNSNYYFLCI